MNRLKYSGKLVVLGALLLCTRCAEDAPVQPATGPAQLHFSVSLPRLPLDTVWIELTLNHWDQGDSVRLLLPPLYADNPMLVSTAANFHFASLCTPQGESLGVVIDSVQMGPLRVGRLSCSAAALPLRFRYGVSFNFDSVHTGGMPIPRLGTADGYLQGNYLFVIPADEQELSRLWRRQRDISVSWELGAGVTMYGDPLQVSYANGYELMFSTAALNATVVHEGMGGGQPFRIVHLGGLPPYAAWSERVARDCAVIVQDVFGLFGTLNHPLSIITGNNAVGGLEGSYAFTLIVPNEPDEQGFFNMVVAHEAVHCWIGVRVGEHDDSWWKEGTSNYLGFQIAHRRGLCSRSLVENTLLADFRPSATVLQTPLSDVRVRSQLYDSTAGMIALVYGKGAQVSMLIDERLRRQSAGSSSLEGLCAFVVARFDGGAFDRSTYLQLVRSYSGIGIEDIYRQWVDSAGVIPDTLLAKSWASLVSMGAFGLQPVVAQKMGGGAQGWIAGVRHW